MTEGLLAGIRVLDLGRMVAGPFCARLMADMGAEVIKIEPPGGDHTRKWPYINQGISGFFMQPNLGKKSICVDLRNPKGKQIIRDLVKVSDVLVENFTAGAMDRLGLGFGTLSAINPSLIMCSVSGFGQTGPYARLPITDRAMQAMSGISWTTGDPDGSPMFVAMSICDASAAGHAFGAICAALFSRSRTGKGQYLDVCLLHSTIAQNDWAFQFYLMSGGKVKPTRFGNCQPTMAPANIYKRPDGYMAVASAGENGWRAICDAMGRPELLTDPRFATLSVRLQNRQELEEIMQKWVESFGSIDEALTCLRKRQVNCAKVNSIEEVVNDPQVQARQVFVEVNDPVLGLTKVLNCPIKSAPTPSVVRGSAPLLGDSLVEVLHGVLGYPKKQIMDLLGDGTVSAEERVLPRIFKELLE